MAKRSNIIFALVMLFAFTLVIIASGAGPFVLLLGNAIVQAIVSIFEALVRAVQAIFHR